MTGCCNHGRIIVAGIVFALISYLSGWFVWMYVFAEQTAAHAHLWRPEGDKIMEQGMIVGNLLYGIFLAYVFAKLSCSMCCNCPFQKGAKIGFLLWLPFGFAAGIFCYAIHPISMDLLLANWLNSALTLIVGGAVLSRIINGSSCDMLVPAKAPVKSAPVARAKPKAKKRKR